MTKESLKQRVNELLETDGPFIQKLIDKAINSGAMDVENAEDNFKLPKNLLCAIYNEMSNQYAPLPKDKKSIKEVNNISVFL